MRKETVAQGTLMSGMSPDFSTIADHSLEGLLPDEVEEGVHYEFHVVVTAKKLDPQPEPEKCGEDVSTVVLLVQKHVLPRIKQSIEEEVWFGKKLVP